MHFPSESSHTCTLCDTPPLPKESGIVYINLCPPGRCENIPGKSIRELGLWFAPDVELFHETGYNAKNWYIERYIVSKRDHEIIFHPQDFKQDSSHAQNLGNLDEIAKLFTSATHVYTPSHKNHWITSKQINQRDNKDFPYEVTMKRSQPGKYKQRLRAELTEEEFETFNKNRNKPKPPHNQWTYLKDICLAAERASQDD